MASEFKGLHVKFEGDTTDLQSALKKIDAEAKSTQRNLKSINRALKFNPGNTTLLAQKLREIGNQSEKLKARLKTLKQAESEIGKENMSTAQWDKLQLEIIETESKLKHFAALQKQTNAEIASSESKMGKAGAAIKQFGDDHQNASRKVAEFGSAYTRTVSTGIVAAGALSVKAAVDIDTSLTNVRKTVDGTEQDYQRLKESAIEFSKTNAVSAAQILDIQALGAQLGFSIDELENFGEVVSGLDIATDMDADTAATEMAQFANITGMAHDQVSNYASSLVALGNSTATTESAISSMAQRVGAAGTQVGMSQADILGLSAALSSLGIEAEAGGTAISKTLTDIDTAVSTNSDSLQRWAEVAGMSVEEFTSAWGNDATGTFEQVIQGMSKVEENGGNLSLVLEELGINEVRQTDTLKRLAGNYGLLDSSIKTANDGWTKNTALANEVANRNESLASKFEILKNRVIAVAEDIGTPLANALLEALDAMQPLFDMIESGAEAFSNMSDEQQRFVLKAVAAAAALGPLLSMAGNLGSAASGIGDAMEKLSTKLEESGKKAAFCKAAIGGVGAALAALAVAYVAKELHDVYVEMENVESISRTLASTTAASGQAMETSMDGTSMSVRKCSKEIESLVNSTKSMQQGWHDSWTTLAGTDARLQNAMSTMSELRDTEGLTASEQYRLTQAVEEYNSITGQSVSVTDASNGSLSASTEELQTNADAWYDNAAAQQYAAQMGEAIAKREEAYKSLQEAQEGLTQAEKDYAEAKVYGGYIEEQAYHNLDKQKANVKEAEAVYDACGEAVDEYGERMGATNQRLLAFVDGQSGIRGALDGTTTQFTNMLDTLGVTVDTLEQGGASVQTSWVNAFNALIPAAEAAGVPIETFAQSLQAAGVDLQKVGQIGPEQFRKLYDEAGGDLNALMQKVNDYNATPMDPKDAQVNGKENIDGAKSAVDDYNATPMNGKVVSVAGKASVDAVQASVNVLNATPLNPKTQTTTDNGTNQRVLGNVKDVDKATIRNKSFSITAHDRATSVISGISNVLSRLTNKDIWVTTHERKVKEAMGGINIPRHAAGGFGVATQPTLRPYGQIGEDGWEAVVPLTNRLYVRPFAQAVAREFAGISGSGNTTNYNLSINGATINDDEGIRNATMLLLSELQRKAAMNIGRP